MQKEKIAQGAEAVLYKEDNKIIKERIVKKYRIVELDTNLRRERTRLEARILRKLARAGIPVPAVLKVDEERAVLEIEFIDGKKLRDYLLDTKDYQILAQVGKIVAQMHSQNICHGDLTTSNMILKENTIYLIDFGLAIHSTRIEDKAVDLHLFKECLKSKHFEIWETAWKTFLANYEHKDVIERLKVVERRGRYKEKAPI
ncbi:MAG: KEOPS complex kinase/ATPase Bud32 [Candidatus Nanoarchaeia archaeon]